MGTLIFSKELVTHHISKQSTRKIGWTTVWCIRLNKTLYINLSNFSMVEEDLDLNLDCYKTNPLFFA